MLVWVCGAIYDTLFLFSSPLFFLFSSLFRIILNTLGAKKSVFRVVSRKVLKIFMGHLFKTSARCKSMASFNSGWIWNDCCYYTVNYNNQGLNRTWAHSDAFTGDTNISISLKTFVWLWNSWNLLEARINTSAHLLIQLVPVWHDSP